MAAGHQQEKPVGRRRADSASIGAGEFPMTEADFTNIARILYDDAGIHLSPSKATLVYSRLSKRLRSLGIAEGLAGKFESSVKHLRLALSVIPEDQTALYVLAYSAFGMGDLATSIAALERLLTLDPGHAQGRLLLERLRE